MSREFQEMIERAEDERRQLRTLDRIAALHDKALAKIEEANDGEA